MKRIIILIILFFPFSVKAFSVPEISSSKALIYDMNEDLIIYEKAINEKTSIASLTKILTVITALENISNLEEEITITNKMLENIFWDASIAGLKVGDKVSYLELIYATILPSGADAAQVLALNISNTIPEFVAKMNILAKNIGMENSYFLNPFGLDTKNQYSTANDVLILLKYALKNETFKKVFTTRDYTLNNGLNLKSTLYMYNKKVNLDISPIIGSKTGRTGWAGLCLASLINFKKHEILIITLNAPDNNSSNLVDNISLIKAVNESYVIPFPVKQIEINDLISALKTSVEQYNPYANIPFYLLPFVFFLIFLVIIRFKRKKTL